MEELVKVVKMCNLSWNGG